MSQDFNFSPSDKQVTFVLVMVSYDSIDDSIGIEPLGVYSSVKDALKYATDLEKCTQNKSSLLPPNNEVMFDVLEFYMDEEPTMLQLLKKRKDQLQDEVDKAVIKLMKRGIVDQLVGEDGNFYYTLTEKGEGKMSELKLPKYITKFFKKRND